MPLKPYLRKETGIWHIRGSHHGVAVDRSSFTRKRADAEKVIERIEREIFDEVVLKKPKERGFAEAAVIYMKAGGERTLLAPILKAVILVDKQTRVFGELLLKEIDQGVIDAVADALYPKLPDSKENAVANRKRDATRNRKVFTPISSVLNTAARQKSWNYAGFRLIRPAEPKGRLDWRTPEEIEWWIGKAGHAAGIITCYAGTGMRASEPVNLEWPGVSIGNERFTLADTETKAAKERSIDLQTRVRLALPERPAIAKGRVFRNADGEPWHSYDAINGHLERVSIAETFLRATPTELAELKALEKAARTPRRWLNESAEDFRARSAGGAEVRAAAGAAFRQKVRATGQAHDVPWIHIHIFRHTWATWAYAVTKDLTFLMEQGGWESEKLALRYVHGATPSLAAAVRAHGWEIRDQSENAPYGRQNAS